MNDYERLFRCYLDQTHVLDFLVGVSGLPVRTLLSTHLSNTLIEYMYAYIHISHSTLIRE